MEEELLDWELLHGSDTESTDSITSDKKSESSSVIDDGMMILSDHFTLHNPIKRSGETTDPTQNGVVELDDSFRVDYGSEPPNQRQNPGEFRVDSSSGHLDVNRSGDADVRNELGSSDFPCRGSISNSEISSDGGEVRGNDFEADDEKHVESEIVAELTGGTLSHYEDASMCLPESDHFKEPIEDSSKSWSDSGVVNGQEEIVSDSGVVSTEEIQGSEENTVQAVAVNSGDESKSRETVWWKMPFVLLRYSAFRIGPLWSVSMAAAVMGIVILGRRLYNMKKKAQRFHLKVAIDDKKVSRVMSQAARLNEVFTEVRRIPVIRPALPSPGAWPPVLSLR